MQTVVSVKPMFLAMVFPRCNCVCQLQFNNRSGLATVECYIKKPILL
jgi:hypothetical protein